jgi:hypothetical protein
MKFTKSEQTLNDQDIVDAEAKLGIKFPLVVRNFYLSSNGGIPEPYVFENDDIDTVISEFLPLISERRGTALQAYERLVTEKQLVPWYFFPFAVDGGGDYFFVDTSISEGPVYFYRSDSADNQHLLSLNIGFEKFWTLLKDEI